MKKPQAGFTIIELIVIIVVIGILASITIASYRGTQDSANDTAIKNAVSQMADAIQLWSTRNNMLPSDVYRAYDPLANKYSTTIPRTGGWAQIDRYPEATPEGNLIREGYLPTGFSSKLKSTTATNQTSILMAYPCSNGRYAVYASLSDDSQKTTHQQAATAAGCNTTTFTTYKMNYVLIF